MTLSEVNEQCTGKWENVRPVVIYFAGERFVVEYNDQRGTAASPVVAMVHSYLGNLTLTKNDH